MEDALRQREFAFIEFRDSPVRCQAYIQETRVAVWQVSWLARHYAGDADRIAAHLDLPAVQITAALNYAAAYPAEIDAATADNAATIATLKRLLPRLEVVSVDSTFA
jgi:uncharacterized protein (DUF433 family)